VKISRGGITLFLFFILFGSSLLSWEIHVKPGPWGNVKTNEIERVLESTTQVFLPHVSIWKHKNITVSHSMDKPRILYGSEKNKEIKIQLSARDRYWCQYAFQFSHELGHLMCGYKRGDLTNQWFEESVAETASLYALAKLEEIWTVSPPFQSWRPYAIEFTKYRNQRILKSSYPENFQLSSWWKQNRQTLSNHSQLRKQNLWVAIKLYDLFSQNPDLGWRALGWLNHKKMNSSKDFEQYLQDWKNSCPEVEQKQFVEQVSKLFGLS